MSGIQGHNYEEAVISKLNDEQLRANLKTVMTTLKTNRKNLIESRFVDWEGLRKKGRNAKIKALSRLDELLEEFEKNATRNGMQVHWASNSDEANEIIYNLAKQKGVNKILKAKSMASEEIHLNAFLKQKGVEAIETDLGELIIQLVDDPPVHIVAPAIHKNRYQIGEIFKQKLNAPLESEPEKLNSIARAHLRKEFKDFKMGLSGVNFAVANEGLIWLIENEGNGRMSTTACDIHVAICGIEKVVESLEDASVLVSLLAPSATGTPITAYNNIIASPRKEGEKDGPREVHIVMLDNHRSTILSDSKLFQSLNCIRCGTCLNHCPVYDKIGGHAYLSTYPGPIGELISPQLFGLKNYGYMVNLCSLCERCSEVCPVQIPLAELIRDLRSEKAKEGRGNVYASKEVKPNAIEKFAMKQFANIASSPMKWQIIFKLLYYFGNIGKVFAPLVPGVRNWTKYRKLPYLSGNLNGKIKNLKGVIYE